MIRNLFLTLCCCYLISSHGFAQSANPFDQGRLTPDIQQSLLGLKQLSGPSLQSESLENKVVIVSFFATWCVPCRVELNHLNQLYRMHYRDGFEVVAVNYFEDFDNFSNDQKLQRFLKKFQFDFPVVKGTDAISIKFGKITRIPTLFVFDRQGQNVLKFSNQGGNQKAVLHVDELKPLIESLL